MLWARQRNAGINMAFYAAVVLLLSASVTVQPACADASVGLSHAGRKLQRELVGLSSEAAEGVIREQGAEGEEATEAAEGVIREEGAEGAEGAEAEEENAEEEPTDVGVAIAATLIGAISFVMCLYYFTSYPDADIQEMTWLTISRTISIFCAVLMFSSLNDLSETYIITPLFGENPNEPGALLIDILQMLFWFVVLQLFLALASGAWGPCSVDLDEFEELSNEEKDYKIRKKKVNMACYAVLLAHITGFASINAFVTLQQQSFFAASWWRALLVAPIVLLFNVLLQRVTDFFRESVAGGDGEKDVFEDLWDGECEMAENDVLGLALSFTTVNALRFLITGCLPNQEGKEEECAVEEYLYKHAAHDKLALLGFGLVCAFAIFVIRLAWPACLEPKAIRRLPSGQQHIMSLLSRLFEGIYVAFCMAFSWFFFYGAQMVIAGLPMFNERVEILAVVVALVLSFFAMGSSIPLDKLADSDCTGPKCDDAIRSIMSAMGLLIGFAWEQCFDQSVEDIAMTTNNSGIPLVNEHSTKFFLTLFCASLLVPAWKWYILPYIVAMGWHYQLSQDGFRIEDLTGLAKTYITTGGEGDERDESEEWFREEDSDDEASDTEKEEKRQQTLERIQRVKKVLKATLELADAAELELLKGKKNGERLVDQESDGETPSEAGLPPIQCVSPTAQQSRFSYTPLGHLPLPTRPAVSSGAYGAGGANSSRTMYMTAMPSGYRPSSQMPGRLV